jgi:hypothetical protein
MPVRIQRKRSKGWRKSTGVYEIVARPKKWGNPYDEIEKRKSRFGPGYYRNATATMLYHRDLLRGSLGFTVDDVIRELKGKDLMCWCGLDKPCHADVLLEVANDDPFIVTQLPYG